MNVSRATAPSDGKNTVHIYTREGVANGLAPSVRESRTSVTTTVRTDTVTLRPSRAPGAEHASGTRFMTTVRTAEDGTRSGATVRVDTFDGLLIVDGVVTDPSALGRLDHQDIAGIEILKGEAAKQAYDDPRAANGVIRVTTKRGRQ
jgi:hypothetical protein